MSSTIKNSKALIFLVVVLLLSNVGLLLYFLVWKKPGNRQWAGKKGDFSIVDFMKKEVGFNVEQTKQFKELHEKNWDSLKVLGDSIRNTKNELYKLLQRANTPDSMVNRAAEQLAQNQKSMELTMFRHIQRVRAICDSQQQVKLDSLVSRMNNRSPWYRRGGSSRSDGEKRQN